MKKTNKEEKNEAQASATEKSFAEKFAAYKEKNTTEKIEDEKFAKSYEASQNNSSNQYQDSTKKRLFNLNIKNLFSSFNVNDIDRMVAEKNKKSSDAAQAQASAKTAPAQSPIIPENIHLKPQKIIDAKKEKTEIRKPDHKEIRKDKTVKTKIQEKKNEEITKASKILAQPQVQTSNTIEETKISNQDKKINLQKIMALSSSLLNKAKDRIKNIKNIICHNFIY